MNMRYLTTTIGLLLTLSLCAATASAQYGTYLETFDGFLTPSNIGTHADWINGGATFAQAISGEGVASTVGVSVSNRTMIWSAHPFDPTDTEFTSAVFRMDFETDGSGRLDDDRLGWTITDANDSSDNIFGVQIDPQGTSTTVFNIETYWDTASGGGSNFRDSLATLPTLSSDSWYQLELVITPLTATSASMAVEFWALDSSGNRTGSVLATATIADTNSYGTNKPDTKYFTDSEVFPVYKNYNARSGYADNAYASILPEPATIGLLSVGGVLVLRRRRR